MPNVLGEASQPLRIIFAGTPEFAAADLQALIDSPHNVVAVYTQPDRAAGRGQKQTPGPVKKLALAHDIEVCQPLSLKRHEELERLEAFAPDLMVVAAYGLILPPLILSVPTLGCINVHASLLPRWRGAAPIQRAIQAGDEETGITIMQMDAGLDTGAMLYNIKTPISEEDTGGSLHDRLANLGSEALIATLKDLPGYQAQAQAQDDALATYAHKLEKPDALLDWQQPATALAHMVRAFNPWPVAQAKLNDQVLRIWQAVALNMPVDNQPGTIVAATKEGIDVACGVGVLRLLEVQMAGGRKMNTAALLNSKRDLFSVGTHFYTISSISTGTD